MINYNRIDKYNRTPLFYTSYCMDYYAVKQILESEGDQYHTDINGHTVLEYLYFNNKRNIDIMKLLICHNVDYYIITNEGYN
jgi:ankyrin repeat protein